MINTNALNIFGLVANLISVILLFRYGMPYRVRTEGVGYLITQDVDKREVTTERRYDLLGKLGLLLIVAGTLAQIGAVLM
jgi:hypothetical protein